MTAFAAGIDIIFANPHMARDARYMTAAGETAVVRLIVQRPDTVRGFGETQVATDTILADVRVAEVPAPGIGDMVEIGDEAFVVQSEPLRDRERLVWTLDLRPA